MTITSVGGQNVLNVENLRLINSETLTLVGSPGDTFIININRQYSLSGSSQIILSGGLTPQDVVFNFPTAGAQISVTGPAIATGIIVAPSRTYTSSGGVFNGEVVACNIDINEGAVINNPAPPTSPTPTPTPRTITVVVLPCEAGRNLPRIQFVGDRTSLTFFLNGQQVFPDVNGIVEVQPGQYHWEAFLAIQRIAEGDVTVIDCAIQQTPTPSPSPPMMTPTPTPPTVPEPITIVLFGTGLASLGFAARRRLGRTKVGNSDTESTEN
jgi:hypothetical protein